MTLISGEENKSTDAGIIIDASPYYPDWNFETQVSIARVSDLSS
jgi:hypothetical protein